MTVAIAIMRAKVDGDHIMSAERAGVLFNQRGGTGHRVTVALISAFLMAIVFVIDTFTDIEGAIAVLYVMALLLGSEILTRTGLLLTSIVCIFLTVLSYFLTHGPDPDLQTFIRLAVALAALKQRRPAKLEWGVGRVGVAMNPRTKGGPIDHELPVLMGKDRGGEVLAG